MEISLQDIRSYILGSNYSPQALINVTDVLYENPNL